MMCLFSETIQKYNNHPVHIIDMEGNLSPSALIPFCEFGGNMSIMGTKIDQFEVPVCNSFHAKVLNDQLCYEVDLNKYSNHEHVEQELKLGFYFLMDYNEDRQIPIGQNNNEVKEVTLANTIIKADEYKNALIHLNTIGTTREALKFGNLPMVLGRTIHCIDSLGKSFNF